MWILNLMSWFFVIVFTIVNIFAFLKLKKASEQMMKMAFPGSSGSKGAPLDMKDIFSKMQQMQQMMSGMNQSAGKKNAAKTEDPMRLAMNLLKNMQKNR